MSDLQILYPKPQSVLVGSKVVSIRPIEFRHFDEFGKAAGELIPLIAEGDISKIYEWSKGAGVVRSVLLNCTDLSRWRIGRLPASIAIELMLHVVALNSGFFVQALVSAENLLAGEKSPRS